MATLVRPASRPGDSDMKGLVTVVSARDGGPVAGLDASVVPAPRTRRAGSGFWFVAFAFLIVMAVATLPSPLYGLYRTRDHLSALTITVVFAIFAAGTIATLQRDSAVTARIGRRGMMLSAVVMMMVAMGVLAAWKDLPGLLIGRALTGVAVGLAAGPAITYLVELRLRADPHASVARARTIGTSVNVGALGVGPLIAGCLAQWVSQPLTVPYLVFIALGAVALAGLWVTPETGAPASGPRSSGPRRSVRLPVPAAARGASAARPPAIGQAPGAGRSRDPRRLRRKWPVRGAVRPLPGHYAAPSLARVVRRLALPVVFLRSGLPAGHGRAAGITRARPRNNLDARGPGAARGFRAPRPAQPHAVPDRGCADRRGFWCGLQGDDRDRARGQPARKPRRDDVGPAHRALCRASGPGDRGRGRAQPGCERAQHRARVRHPRRRRRCRLRLGAAATPARGLRNRMNPGVHHVVAKWTPGFTSFSARLLRDTRRAGLSRQSHRNVRAARAIATAAQTASVTVLPTGNATPYCRTLRRPVESAPVGSSSSTGRAAAGNLVSGNTTPPTPSSRM